MSKSTYQEIFLSHRERLIARAAPIVRCRTEAEDVVHEAFLRFCAPSSSAARNGAAPASAIRNPVSYLYAIVQNIAIDRARRVKRGPIQPADLNTFDVPGSQATPEKIAIDRERLLALQDALGELPERTRIAFIMRRVENRSYAEIAERLEVSTSRAHQLVVAAMRHALTKMRASGVLAENEGPDL